MSHSFSSSSPSPSLPGLPSIAQPPLLRAETLLTLLEHSAQGDYIGESISQLEHSLQAAHLALKANASNSTISAALLHDIGQFLPLSVLKAAAVTPTAITTNGDDNDAFDETPVGRPNHATTGGQYLSWLGFPATVTSLVREHVNAKKYLCAVDPTYHAALSEASRASLRQQGGAMGHAERTEWERVTVGWEDCLRVRRWDDQAKVVAIEDQTLRCGAYVGIVASCLE